ncbi:membrane protein UL121 [Aotine betaherpesvirus 1]|uniref:Membrane protein UL121 n=1 Tax=Aotine betaherpesvirus 1 TaxID=50290 RepID=G8XUH8_9BETA|nr:membrane protein UL121 [Aotine betaherpesvirus 1]AEV80808.1 membrane protein UL121 [Aotine betaherpesvirus 1]
MWSVVFCIMIWHLTLAASSQVMHLCHFPNGEVRVTCMADVPWHAAYVYWTLGDRSRVTLTPQEAEIATRLATAHWYVRGRTHRSLLETRPQDNISFHVRLAAPDSNGQPDLTVCAVRAHHLVALPRCELDANVLGLYTMAIVFMISIVAAGALMKRSR